MEVSITKALAELKKIDSRIAKNESFSRLGACCKVIEKDKISKAQSEAQSAIQSYQDNMKRKQIIKKAIAAANIKTVVNFPKAKENTTIYDLIVEKQNIQLEKDMYMVLSKRLVELETAMKKENSKLDLMIQNVVEKAYGNNNKPSSTFVEDITKSHYSVSETVVACSMSLEEVNAKIIELEDAINNIDIYLSEINAKTLIDIPE